MKTMSKKIAKDAYKSKDEIDSLISEMETSEETTPFAPIPMATGNLVGEEYYRGKLFPMIQNYLPEGMELTKDEQVQLVKGVQRKLTGLSASMPIKCYGDACPFSRECPLHKMGKAPVGESCPMEAMVLDTYTKRYIEEFEVEPDNFSEVVTMTQLAATHIMEMRGFIAIGKDDEGESPDGIIKNVVGYTPDEDPITQYQEHPGYLIIERAWRWRSKLLESLGATRKDKLKFNTGDDDNLVKSLSEANASLRSKIDRLTTIDVEV